ncbi:hypothetical protein BDY19DRAFT_950527 [Irpex rosettiformis]|uniref:Uncharacterized protein n=1 Tax=Irpex rosettiformis TaxID=378272 RepID=A0ACB8U1X8_9APHY|nr:hypothetical protein BDY19DRAFT_950527 [Irpex rosettiformis]
MSFLLGPVSGALVAGGVYYGFSTMIQDRTLKHRVDLHKLSIRLTDASTIPVGPLPASERIQHRPFVSMMKNQWNIQVETLFRSIGDLNRKAGDWTKRTLYREYSATKKD